MASKGAPTLDQMASKEASPSVNEIINWQTEYSIDFGHIGWSRNHPKAEFSTKNKNAAYANAASSAPSDLLAMMDAALNEEAAKQKCMLECMQYMEAHPERVKEAELEVNSRLLQAGKTQLDIESYVDDEEVFRRKVEDLYNIEHPPPPRDGVDAYIEYGLADNRRLASIQLEIKGSLNEFLNDRESHLARHKDIWEPLESIYYEGSPWQYKWKPQDKSIEFKEKWFPLETQHDYSVLTKKAAKAANLADANLTPVLSQKIKTEYHDPQKEEEEKREAQRNAMYAELDKKWGVVPSDTINTDEDGWTDVDVARDFAPGGALYDWAMERMHKGIAERKAQEEMEEERAANDKKRMEANAARAARQMSPPRMPERVIRPKPTRALRRAGQASKEAGTKFPTARAANVMTRASSNEPLASRGTDAGTGGSSTTASFNSGGMAAEKE
ncbi:MAG: hypothetical protein Q9207_006197 [Kuettlingeria erythrocarpa]